MSELSVAKGLNSEDYANNWAVTTSSAISLTTTLILGSSKSLSGKAFKIDGEKLAAFKQKYKNTHNQSLGRINTLWIGDWEHAYAYMTQGVTEAARDFQNIGSNAVERVIKSQVQPVSTVNTPTITEEQLQECIQLLSSYSTINLRFEVGVKNTFDSGAMYRRWDFVEVLFNVVKIYELKRNTITEQDIKDKLDRNYIELAAQPVFINTLTINKK